MRIPIRAILLLLAAGCHDPDECTRLGAQQCGDNGRSIVTCAQTERGLRWGTAGCEPGTPTCVELRDGTATCIGESLGPCEEASFASFCVDGHTLEECTAGTRHHVRCVQAETCGPVSEGVHACYALRPSAEPPALVAFVSGDVRLGDRPAPALPFRVPAGTTLRLGEGARAIVLVKERPTRLEGPLEVDVYTLQPDAVVAAPWAVALEAILAADPPRAVPPEEPLLAPAPSQDGLVRVVIGEGLPGASATLGDLSWRCFGEESCGRTIELRAQGTNERVVWRGNGPPGVRYGGPDLEAGETYQLRVGDRSYRVETLRPPDLRPLLASMSDWALSDQMAVIAAVHRWSGSRAAALEALRRAIGLEGRAQDAALQSLVAAYQGGT